jgi:hypothetical protein
VATATSKHCLPVWAGGGRTEPNGLPVLYARGATAIGRGGHLIQKARYHWPWAVGAGVVGTVGGGMGTVNEGEGGGVFFTADLCPHLSHWRFSKVCMLLIPPVG